MTPMEVSSHVSCCWIERWSDSDGRRGDRGRLRLLASPPLVFNFLRCREPDKRSSASSSYMRTLAETQDLRLGYVRACMRHVLAESGGSNLGFGN
jgi:hypothetical protein